MLAGSGCGSGGQPGSREGASQRPHFGCALADIGSASDEFGDGFDDFGREFGASD